MVKVLLVEDDLAISERLATYFRADNNVIECAGNGGDALQLLASFKYDVILLDWNLPDMTGLKICRSFREQGGKTPIIFLTGEGDVEHKETALDSGADDYIVKPFEVRELMARIRSILRRPSELLPNQLALGAVALDRETGAASCEDKHVHLAPRERAVLEFLMRHPNKHFSSKDILNAVWPSDNETNEDNVRTTVKTLRKKLMDLGQPEFLKTVKGAGYIVEFVQET